VVLITPDLDHACLVGDRFLPLKRGRMAGSHTRAEITLEQLTAETAGGSALAEPSHELRRAGVVPADPGEGTEPTT
jgi:simple sugar transport system ATP-binding protein